MLNALTLSKGKTTILDKEDWDKYSRWKWTYLSSGYAYRQDYTSRAGGLRRTSTTRLLHREIMNAKKGEYIDHINGDKLDNRRLNLRVCTHSQNCSNRGRQRNNTSGFKGVWWNRQRSNWGAKIWVNRKQIYLGSFKDRREAAKAYDHATIKYFGQFGKVNI